MDWERLLEIDREHVWHPYGPMPAARSPLPVVSAQGVRLTLADGRELIDGMASWWCAIHGYRHPVLDRALVEQSQRMSHVMFGGLTHEPALTLTQRLVELAPDGLDRIFFADSGSISVEVAIKMALQYWLGHGHTERSRLLTIRGGYHGDTFGAMAVCDPVGGMHQLFTGVLPQHLFAPQPPGGVDRELDPDWLATTTALIERHAHELAAVIVEPVVQGAGGMYFYAPAYVKALRELCDAHGLLLILDEIATGFGRAGTLFACERAGITPDILCVGKALGGGYMTIAATLTTKAVADAITAGESGVLMHGPTFMANPLACAVSAASLELLQTGAWQADVARIQARLATHLLELNGTPGVKEARVLGAIGVVQLDRPVDMAQASNAAVERGVWLRPFRDLIYTMPPYIASDDDIDAISAAIKAAVHAQR